MLSVGLLEAHMIKLILTTILCLWASVAGAFPGNFLATSVGSASAPADYCSDKLTGGWSLYFDADHPDGTTTACISGGTTTVARTAGVTASNTVNTTSGGIYGNLWHGTTHDWVNVPANGISTQNGRVSFTFTTPSTVPADHVTLFEWDNGSSQRVTVYLWHSSSTYSLRVAHVDGSTTTAETAYVSLSGSTSYTVVADWNSTTGIVYGAIGATTDTTSGTISSFTTPANGVRFGEDQTGLDGNSVGWGFDDIKMGVSQQ